MKKKLLILSLLIVIGSSSFANARDDMKYIDKLYGAREYNLAIDELKSFIIKYPNSNYTKVALERLAKTLYLNKSYKDSIIYFKEYLNYPQLKLEEKDESYYYLARNNIYLKNYNQAKSYINKISNSSPSKKADGIFYLGVSHYNNKEYVIAQKTFKILLDKQTHTIDALLYLSLSFFNNGEYIDANTYLEKYLNSGGKLKELELASYIYGLNLYKLGDNQKGALELENFEKKYPGGKYISDARYGLLEIYLKENNVEKTNEYYNKLKNSKNENKANALIGNHYLQNKDYENAMTYYRNIEFPTESQIYTLAFSTYEVGKKKKGNIGKDMVEASKVEFNKLIGSSFDSEATYYIALIDFENEEYSKVIKRLENYNMDQMNVEYLSNINLFLGKSYYETSRYKESLAYFQKKYNETKNKEELYQLILVNNRIRDKVEIKRLFEEYKKKFPKDLEYKKDVYLLVGNTYYNKGDLDAAKATFKEYLELYKSSKISENFITILINDGDYKELISYLATQPKTLDNIYLNGIGYLGLTEYSNAVKEFDKIISNDSATTIQQEKASFKLVEANFIWKRYEETLKTANSYLNNMSFKENRLEVLKFKGLAHFRLGEYDEAREIFGELEKELKYKEYSQFRIAETYYNEGNYKLSQQIYNELYLSNKDGKYAMQALYSEINILYLQDLYKDVIEKSKEFEAEYPNSQYNTSINQWVGNAYQNLNDVGNAIKIYDKLYNQNDDQEVKNKAAVQLTKLYFSNNDFENAEAWKEKINNESEKTFLSAIIFDKQGKKEEALNEYKKLITDKIYGSKANFNLAANYYEEENFKEAKIYYDNILNIENGEYKDTATYQIGQIYLLEADYSKSLRNFMRIELLYEDSNLREPSKLKIASIYELQGNIERAKKSYEEFYKEYPSSKYIGLVTEKLLVIYINQNNTQEGKKYYDKLLKTNSSIAKTYESYFIN